MAGTRDMIAAWQAWMDKYGYMDGVEGASADDIRMMARDIVSEYDDMGIAYDDDMSADMVAWAK